MHEVDSYYGESTAHSNGFVMGLLCGAAVGAALGLLFAPKAGSELRSQLYDSTERMRRRAGEAYNQASDTVGDLMDKGRSAVRRGRQRAEETIASATSEPTTSGY